MKFDPTGNAAANQVLGAVGGTGGWARDINNHSQIVGYSSNANGQRRATLFNSANPLLNIDLGSLGGPESEADAISDGGIIVGQADTPEPSSFGNVYHAARFDGKGGVTDLTPLSVPPTHDSVAHDVADTGPAVGESIQNLRGATFHVTPPASVNDLTSGYSQAWDTNASGEIVGRAGSSTQIRATYFDPTGGPHEDLGTATGFGSFSSWAWAINDPGDIVGSAYLSDDLDLYNNRAALFDMAADMVWDLNLLIDPTDPDFGTLTLLTAYDINNIGQIVGIARVGSTSTLVAFLLTPDAVPEPSPLTLLVAGLALAWRVRRAAARPTPAR